ncbi:MAG: hypothetical protein KF878_30750, partial [Planctomycetes bacterium]|nr:hypothetical protein [Planctomycetota bacterium]
AAALRVTGLAPGTPVAVVRARGAGPLLLPEDGDLVAAPVAAGDAVDLTDAEPGERYAAFPFHDGAPLPPGRASTRDEVEVEALEARPQVGAVEVAWRAPAGVVVVVRHGPAPITSPRDGELLAWGRARRALVHDCLDPDQRVFYRAFALGPRGTLSPGLEADAVVLGPPPALGAVRATPGDGRVTLAWSWPEGRSYDRVVVRREPAWPDGERAVPRADDPCLVDAEAPLGHALTYELRAALGPTVGRREARVTSKALAELAGFRALPGGRAVALELSLPAGLPPGASVEVVRNAERPPASMDDGSFVRWPRGADRHVDEPLPAGAPVFYRACLVLDGARSPGLLAQATPLERAGQLSGVEVVPGRASLSVRFVPPAERCDEVRVYAAGAPVACDPALLRLGGPLEVPAPPGVPTAVRLAVVYQGAEDASQAVEVAATAWDDVDALVARPATGGVELAWTPPAAPPRAYRLRRAPRGKPDEAVELTVAPDAAHFLDPDVVARRAYEYSLSCRWGPEDAEVETPPRAVEATAWASPPDLERPDVRSLPGAVQASWLPCAPKDRVHWDGVAVFTSERAEGEVRAALDGRLFTADDAPGLGLALVEQRPKGRAREALRLPPPPEGQALTYVLASRSGPVHRAVLVTAALGLPEGFLALRPDAAAATPTVAWTLPPWARPTALAITRGLEEAALAGLDPQELEALSQPWRGDLDPTATSFSDPDALPFVSWGYALEATLQVGAHAVVVTGPRAVVPRCQGGRLAPAVEQARGLFGWGAKAKVEVRFALEGGRAATWPPFELKRGVAGQAGARTVWSYPGGPPPPPFTDEDLGNFTRGMTLVYAVELARKRDALGFTTGEARVTLG